MSEREYRQNDRTIGHCPVCGVVCRTVNIDGRGYCVDHGWVWVDWNPQRKDPHAPPASH